MEIPNPRRDNELLDALSNIESRINEVADINSFIEELHTMYESHHLFSAMLITFASIIEPDDRLLGAEKGVPTAKAFFKGELLAFHLSHLLDGEQTVEAMKDVVVPISDTKGELDRSHAGHIVASTLINLGVDHLYQNQIKQAFMDKYEDSLCPDIRYQLHLRAGFGIISWVTDQARSRVQLQAASDRVQDIDWDKALRDLTS